MRRSPQSSSSRLRSGRRPCQLRSSAPVFRVKPQTISAKARCSLNKFPDNPLDRPAPGEPGIQLPNQGQSVVKGPEPVVTVLEKEDDEKKGGADIDYLQV